MILVDGNLLIYAGLAASSEHEAARDWLDARLNGTARVGLPWLSLLAFLRVSTNPRVFTSPLSPAVAWQQVQEWLECPPTWVPQPTDRHASILQSLLVEPGVTGNLIPDAHLAAIAIEHGLVLCSTDGDFARFRGLRWEDPLGSRSGGS